MNPPRPHTVPPWDLPTPVLTISILEPQSTLVVGFSNRAKGGPVMKQRISRWLVDAITLEYSSSGLQCPIAIRAHSTRGIDS